MKQGVNGVEICWYYRVIKDKENLKTEFREILLRIRLGDVRSQ